MKKTNMNMEQKHRVYGIIGLCALFFVGCVFGFIINGSDRINPSSMTKKQCDDVAERIISAAKNNQPDLIEQLNKVYSENCIGRNFRRGAQPAQVRPQVKNEKLPDTTCEAIEQLLKESLNNENSLDWGAHEYNYSVYTRLAKNGCEQNKEMYQKLAHREQGILAALSENGIGTTNDEKESTCEQIENLLFDKLNRGYDKDDPKWRVERAQIYANLSERGCPENSAKYKELAKQELEIARALTDDNIEQNKHEATEMVETYKRLQMQQEAAKMIEKAKKLTNPAIDFIIQLEKIIEE